MGTVMIRVIPSTRIIFKTSGTIFLSALSKKANTIIEITIG